MTNVTNPNFIAQSTTGTPNQVEDGIDFPHTGLLKALHTASSGRYVISGFNISNTSATSLVVAGGKINYHGNIVDVTGDTVSLINTYTNGYHLLVAPEPTGANDDSVVTVRNPAAINKVAAYTARDTIIAVITHTGNANPHIQYLTHDKTENSLSIAHDNSNDTYTEAASMKVTATGVDIVSSHAHLTIQNTVGDANIIFKGKDNTQVIDALTLDMSENGNAIFSGSVTSAGTVLTGGGIVTNHGVDKLITSGATNTDLVAENALTYNGVTNLLSVAGSIDVTAGTIAANGQITTQNNIAALNGAITGYTVQSNTASVNLGSRQASSELGANPTSGYGIPPRLTLINASPTLATITSASKIIQGKYETYYIGFDSTSGGSHDFTDLQSPINPLQAVGNQPLYATGTEYALTVRPTAENTDAGDPTAHQYAQDSIFGGNAMFAGIIRPDGAGNNKRITIHNITSFAIYLVVIDPDPTAPNLTVMKKKVNGGKEAGSFYFNRKGLTRCVDLARILTNPTGQFYAGYQYPNDMDAIIIQPRESITLQSKLAVANEVGTEFENDVYGQQGLFADQVPNNQNQYDDISQWFVLSSSNPVGFANLSYLANGFWNIPVHMTGTSFACSGTNEIILPPHPPIGTQYSFMVVNGTTNIKTITAGNGLVPYPTGENEMTQHFPQPADYDTLEELTIGSGNTGIAINAGNAKTFMYMADGTWQVIG